MLITRTRTNTCNAPEAKHRRRALQLKCYIYNLNIGQKHYQWGCLVIQEDVLELKYGDICYTVYYIIMGVKLLETSYSLASREINL